MKQLFRRLTAALCTLALCLTSASALSVEDALRLLEDNYVDPLPAAAYEATTLDELFDAVGDPYTYYMSATDYEEFSAGVESETTVTGIGAGIEYTMNGIRITSLLDGGGAKDAGLQIDDYIIAVDGVSCVPAADAHRSLIIGEAGTYVTLTIRHPDGTTQDYRIERRTVTLHNTTVTLENGVGTIDCDSFGSQTGEYFYDGAAEYDDAARVWVVDLRSNTGGFADAAVSALGTFTGFGPKLYYRLNDGSSFYTIFLADAATDKPAIVLVNGYSASASEILSGGINALGAGIVVGSRTYGKGTAQIVLDENGYPDLFDGDSLKVTAYRFYCANGSTTDKIGVIPTICVPDAYTAAVAALLCAEKPETGDYLHFTLNDYDFYVNLDDARSEQYGNALSVLLSALPPDAPVGCMIDGAEIPLDSVLAARQYDVALDSRGFIDVASSRYATQINTLAAYGILRGVGGMRFDPARTLTRAELCAMLAQALNVTNGTGVFSDVSSDSWYCGDVNAIASLGFVDGVGGKRFDPNGTLTQEQFIAVMGRLARFLNFHADDYALALTDEDLAGESLASLASWARASASVLTGYDGNLLYTDLDSIDPQAPVTREQAAATLCKMLKAFDILSY